MKLLQEHCYRANEGGLETSNSEEERQSETPWIRYYFLSKGLLL